MLHRSFRQGPLPHILILVWSLLPAAVSGQEPPDAEGEASEEAAFLFAYRARPGMRDHFDRGYERHLEWHEANADPFVWYGWDIVTGGDVGVFVDGTFGPSPGEFDQRVAPAEDAADFAANVGPFAQPLWRKVYRVRADLGTSRFLEEREPTRFTRALRYRIRPGSGLTFEALLEELASRGGDGFETGGSGWATYELVDGGQSPEYLLLVPARGIVSVGSGGPLSWLAGLAEEPERARADLSGVVTGASSALWLLRTDLTLIPQR